MSSNQKEMHHCYMGPYQTPSYNESASYGVFFPITVYMFLYNIINI